MKIEIFFTPGCPHHAGATSAVHEALAAEKVHACVGEIAVSDQYTALRMQFLGSPTIRINGRDIEPAARLNTSYGLSCRVYTGSSQVGLPPVTLIREALRATLREKFDEPA